jgi:signal transduction histidine kinase
VANKKIGVYENSDVDLLDTIGSTVALSIENTEVSEELQKAYREIKSLNRAKDKVINHLSHELRTPAAVLTASMSVLAKQLQRLPDRKWQSTLERVDRNLTRIVDIQTEVNDIVFSENYEIRTLLSVMIDQCTDILETFVDDENDSGNAITALRERIDKVFGSREINFKTIQLSSHVENRLEILTQQFSHRNVSIQVKLEPGISIRIPTEVLNKVVDGLIRNAVENTPDHGTITITVQQKGGKAILIVKDDGVGIQEDARKRIFEGFFTTRNTMDYSSKRPYDFLAGGKGADLLRMNIFSERYDFKIEMVSDRCKYLLDEKDICPGDVRQCKHCHTEADCIESGGTEFSVYFNSI